MNQHLGINISESYVEFSVLKGSTVAKRMGFPYSGKTNDDRKNAVRAIIDEQSELSQDFENVTLAWCHTHSTLVPSSVFSESTPQEIFRLCFGEDTDQRTIDHNRIFELSVVNVYAVPDWIKSLFVIKFPRIIMQHAGTHQIREVLGSNAFYPKATLVIHEDFFRITITHHNELAFYSSFSYQTAEDIVYHLNFVLQQKEMLNQKGTIELSVATNGEKATAESVLAALERIQHLKQMKQELKDAFLIKSQLLCV